MDQHRNRTPATSDWIAILIGVASGCILGMVGAGASKATVLLKVPIISALVATFADSIIQGVCSMYSHQNLNQLDLLHSIWVGVGAGFISLGGGVLGELLARERAPALDKVVTAVGVATASGDSAGILDLVINGGACGP